MWAFASNLAGLLQLRPSVIKGVNVEAGLTLITAALSILALRQRSV